MPIRELLSKRIRDYLAAGDIASAALNASMDIELLAFEKLFFEKGLPAKRVGDWMLGKYIGWCLDLNLFDTKWANTLKSFNKLRNHMVHNRSFLERLKSDKTKLKRANDLVLNICDFIDQTRTVYKYSIEKENEYSKFFNKSDDW